MTFNKTKRLKLESGATCAPLTKGEWDRNVTWWDGEATIHFILNEPKIIIKVSGDFIAKWGPSVAKLLDLLWANEGKGIWGIRYNSGYLWGEKLG